MKRWRAIIVIVAAVTMLVLICGGFAIIINRLYAPIQAINLPAVPTFAYFTPTSIIPVQEDIPVAVSTPTTQSSVLFPWFVAASPSPSATPTKTLVPYKSPTASPSSMPLFFSSAPTSTFTPQPTFNGTSCRNILYPVKPGYEWTYQVTAGSRSGEVHMKIDSVDGSQGVVTVENPSRQGTGHTSVVCDRDIILNFPALNAEVLLNNALNGTMKADYISGVLAPNEAAFLGTNWALAWQSRYRVSGSGTVIYHGQNFNLVLNSSDITMTCQTLASGEAAFETITVQAGTFRALKVVCVGQGQGTGTVNGTPITGWVSAQATQWFAPYVGMIKMQSNYANIDVFGITIPLSTDAGGGIELRNFVQRP